jgi:hypothetical protein
MTRLNVGNLDRLLRILLGLLLIGMALSGSIGAWGWLGLVPLLTGLSAYCPLYRACGISTTAR